MDKYGGSKVTIIGHENVKMYRHCPIRIEIKNWSTILSLFYHGLAIYADILPLAFTRGKIMRHKESARGKTMIKWRFRDLFL